MAATDPSLLSPGEHTFTASPLSSSSSADTATAATMTFTYIVHGNRNDSQSQTQTRMKPLLVIQCPGWGIGPGYLRQGLSPLLESHFTLLYFIPRGTAGSSRPPGGDSDMGTWTMADDLELLRRHLRLEKFPALLGHSNGGAIVLAYAEKFPLNVDKVILLDHRLLGLKHDTSLMQRRKDDPRYKAAFGRKQARRMKSKIDHDDDDATQSWKEILPLYFFDPDSGVPALMDAMGDDLVCAWCQQAQSACDAELYGPRRRLMVDKLKDVRAKVLIIFGKDDMITAVDNGEVTQRGISPGGAAELKVYDRCGHFPWIEQPERTVRDIVDFLLGS
ncbi:hypothetical protein VTN77DRAFT_6275 [Rasamsonia byssochlamydoides]|uniref:uncharacterized protein n=1 Tax=Rasamsonia byssochlamydoides TaxID=89139 RepID=UPI0037433A9B